MVNVESIVLNVVSEVLTIPLETVKIDSDFKNDLGGDSLDYVEFIMAIEQEFDLTIDDNVSQQFNNIGDVVKYVQQHIED